MPHPPLIAALLIAHGSRRKEANDDLPRLATLLKDRATIPIVEYAYLELATPTIPEAAAACVDQGATAVRLLPYFLSAGAHVVDDLEQHRQALKAQFPHVEFALCPPLGLHPLMIEIVVERLSQTMESAGAIPQA